MELTTEQKKPPIIALKIVDTEKIDSSILKINIDAKIIHSKKKIVLPLAFFDYKCPLSFLLFSLQYHLAHS